MLSYDKFLFAEHRVIQEKYDRKFRLYIYKMMEKKNNDMITITRV